MDECKLLLTRIADSLDVIKEGNVYILANLIKINSALGGE